MKNIVYHKHHIIPKHAGGTDDSSNIIKLTVQEHAEAHHLLFKNHGRWEDYYAWQGLSGQIGKEDLIIEIIKKVNTGRKHTKECCEKKSIALLGKSLIDLHGIEKADQIRQKLKKPKTKEHRENLSLSKTGHKQSIETITKRTNKTSKMYNIINPQGNNYLVKGLPEFCRLHNLDRSAMGKVSRGIFKHHSGWVCIKI